MNSQDRDEVKIRQREEMLARRVGEALDQLNSSDAGGCPDPGIIAAYAEQALGAAESAQWEGHFATCARCRKILRVLAASADTPLAEKEVAQLGELVSAVRAPIEITGGSIRRARPRFVDWRRRWLAPALGAAAVLAVWFAVKPPWRTTDRGASGTLIAQAPQETVPTSLPPEEGQPSRVAPMQDQKKEATSFPDRSSANIPVPNLSEVAPAERRADAGAALDSVSPSAGEVRSSRQAEKKLNSMPDGRQIQPPAIPPPPAAPPQAQPAMEAPAAPQSKAKAAANALGETTARAMGDAASRDKQAAAMQESAGPTVNGTGGQNAPVEMPPSARKPQAFAVFRSTQKYSSLLKAPSGSTLWRAGKGGMIERSADAGKTWVSQVSPSQEDWLAGAAISDTVCWLAGRNGAIARTVDGERWEIMAPPAPAAGTDARLPDWTAITARDSLSATVTASDGRQYATADGGNAWHLQ